MSLNPRDDRRRGRSKSPGKSRSHSRARTVVEKYERRAPVAGEYLYEKDGPKEPVKLLTEPEKIPPYSVSGSYPEDGRRGRMSTTRRGSFDRDIKTGYVGDNERDYIRAVSAHERGRYEPEYQCAKPHDESPGGAAGASFKIGLGQHSLSCGINFEKRASFVKPPSPSGFKPPYATVDDPLAYPDPAGGRQYAEPAKWEYMQPNQKIYMKRQETGTTHGSFYEEPQYLSSGIRHGNRQHLGIVTVEPNRRSGSSQDPSSLAPRMHSLSVKTNHGSIAADSRLSLANAPASPLLEPYRGTYQSISPMPSPLLLADPLAYGEVHRIEPLSPYASDDERRDGKRTRRTARFHDPKEEASILAKALKGDKRSPDVLPLIEILPGLTHEQILDLRVEYKKIVKTGHEKKGVNIAKHIKMRLKAEAPGLLKLAYSCALGQWESEAYWANFWYQCEKNRRELLIESLMGRTNKEIKAIKESFADKKYGDSLVKCLRTELREDKFKKAVLLVLEERRMEESTRLDRDLVESDAQDLYTAVKTERGSESVMISIVVVRSDKHLREVLRTYHRTYGTSFAKDMLKKSGNLVGELLAHILNGVINKPVRDALLVHHALNLSKSDPIRTELLVSRLVRYHWDRPHLELVKREFRARYAVDMQSAVRNGTKGDVSRFCEALCVRRMSDEVREVKDVRFT